MIAGNPCSGKMQNSRRLVESETGAVSTARGLGFETARRPQPRVDRDAIIVALMCDLDR